MSGTTEVSWPRAGILTVSDRSSRGEREDVSGPVLVSTVRDELGFNVSEYAIVPDERADIAAVLRDWADRLKLDVILTTGGTGFAPRDVTPEATLDVIDRQTPGLSEAMRSASLKVTPHAMLSRALSGIRGRTLIVNLPGSPKGARENLASVAPALRHGLELLAEKEGADLRH
jgi:molybdopterin adenylyltransferase